MDSVDGLEDFDISSFEDAYVSPPRVAPSGRPWVMTNFVVSPDGSAASDGRVGALTDPLDQHLFGLLRSIADVILVGAGTVRAEGYGPHRPSARQRDARVERGQQPTAPLAVVTASCDLDPRSAMFTSSEAIPKVITSAAAERRSYDRLAAVADLVVAGEEEIDLAGALRHLGAGGARVVLCEGGPVLLGRLLAQGLVDEMCVTLAPLLVADPVRMLPAGALTRRIGMTLAGCREHDSHLFLRYLIDDQARSRP